MRRRVLEVELNRHASLIRGWGSRELSVEVKGSAPVYVPGNPGGWSCQETTARDIVALAEHRGFDVVITGRRQAGGALATPGAAESHDTPQTPAPEPEVSLW